MLNKGELLLKIGEVYEQGGNLIQYINSKEQSGSNSKESILISYDYQAGSYVADYKKDPDKYLRYTRQIIDEICALGECNTILEAGVGEANTLKHVINGTGIPPANAYGFDISWSRIKVANEFLIEDTVHMHQLDHVHGDGECTDYEHHKIETREGVRSIPPNLFVADMFSIPLHDNAIDIVYTMQAVEPNGGNEKPILEELYRVARKYLLLFEPDYELSGNEARKRMEYHGYVKNLAGVASSLGYDVVKHELLSYYYNELNPVSVIIIDKQSSNVIHDSRTYPSVFQCPLTRTELIDYGECFFAPQPRLMYPVISGIPCLLESNAVLGCRYGV